MKFITTKTVQLLIQKGQQNLSRGTKFIGIEIVDCDSILTNFIYIYIYIYIYISTCIYNITPQISQIIQM